MLLAPHLLPLEPCRNRNLLLVLGLLLLPGSGTSLLQKMLPLGKKHKHLGPRQKFLGKKHKHLGAHRIMQEPKPLGAQLMQMPKSLGAHKTHRRMQMPKSLALQHKHSFLESLLLLLEMTLGQHDLLLLRLWGRPLEESNSHSIRPLEERDHHQARKVPLEAKATGARASLHLVRGAKEGTVLLCLWTMSDSTPPR